MPASRVARPSLLLDAVVEKLPASRMRHADLVASRREKFLFGALALLVDNAVYRGAAKLSIFSAQFGSERPSSSSLSTCTRTTVPPISAAGEDHAVQKTVLCLMDDGRGFSAKDARDVLCAPDPMVHQQGRALSSSIHYGNLVCLGAMRTAADCLLFCKGGDGVLSCMLLSQTLQQDLVENVNDHPATIRSPLVSWQLPTAGVGANGTEADATNNAATATPR